MSLGPLPEITERPYEKGDVVVYDGCTYIVQNSDDGQLTLENATDSVHFVPSTFVSLL